MCDWRASEYSGESWLFQVDAVAVFADLFMPSFQKYGVAFQRVLCGESGQNFIMVMGGEKIKCVH